MAYEDVDYCLRAWQAGFPRCATCPAAELDHLESVTRGTRGRASASEPRSGSSGSAGATSSTPATCAPPDGGLRVDLRDRGHRRRRRPPRHLRAPQRAARPRTRGRAVDARRASRTGSSCARRCAPSRTTTTWSRRWRRSRRSRSRPGGTPPRRCGEASVVHGIPVYFVQDIETSYYPDDACDRSTRCSPPTGTEFRYMTISSWNRDRLRELGLDADADPARHRPDNFRPLADVERRRRHDPGARPLQPAEEPAADARRVARAARAAARAVPVRDRARAAPRASRASATSPRPPTTRSTPAQRGDRVRADLDARGLLPAAARGDGRRRAGRLHRRARQPRLLPRRAELPDADCRPRRRWRTRSRGCSAIRPLRARSARSGIETAADYAWRAGSTRSSASSTRSPRPREVARATEAVPDAAPGPACARDPRPRAAPCG